MCRKQRRDTKSLRIEAQLPQCLLSLKNAPGTWQQNIINTFCKMEIPGKFTTLLNITPRIVLHEGTGYRPIALSEWKAVYYAPGGFSNSAHRKFPVCLSYFTIWCLEHCRAFVSFLESSVQAALTHQQNFFCRQQKVLVKLSVISGGYRLYAARKSTIRHTRSVSPLSKPHSLAWFTSVHRRKSHHVTFCLLKLPNK